MYDASAKCHASNDPERERTPDHASIRRETEFDTSNISQLLRGATDTLSETLRRLPMDASGRVVTNEGHRYLKIARSLSLPIEETWAFLTESELTERWFGPWEGDARAGGSVRVRMRFESNEAAIRVNIRACDAPNRLVMHVLDEGADWELSFDLEADGDEDTVVVFTQLLTERVDIGEVGPGWEYYLDLLVAATEDTEEPSFEQYFPAMSAQYLAM